jgi:hypothetical protein
VFSGARKNVQVLVANDVAALECFRSLNRFPLIECRAVTATNGGYITSFVLSHKCQQARFGTAWDCGGHSRKSNVLLFVDYRQHGERATQAKLLDRSELGRDLAG